MYNKVLYCTAGKLVTLNLLSVICTQYTYMFGLYQIIILFLLIMCRLSNCKTVSSGNIGIVRINGIKRGSTKV